MSDVVRSFVKTGIENQRKVARWSYSSVYLFIAVPILVLLCFCTGPFQVPDEPSHFFRAIQVSHGFVEPMLGPDGHSAGGLIENSAISLVSKLGNETIDRDPSHRFKFRDVTAERSTEKSDGLSTYVAFNNTAIYFPLAHALPALTIFLAREAGTSPFMWLYIGRLSNALAAAVVSAVAIEVFEESGLFALVLCSVPMVLFEEASLSADALVIPFSVLLAALVARIARNRSLDFTFYIALSISLAYVCVAKIAYIPLVLLPPLVAVVQRRTVRVVGVLSIISVLAVVVWIYWSTQIHGKVFTINFHAGIFDVQRQLQSILTTPLLFPAVLVRSICNASSLRNLIGQAVGSSLGWHDVMMPKPLVFLSLGTLFAAIVFRRSITPFRLVSRGITGCLILGSLVAVYLLLYLQYTPIGKSTVDGLQGRYLIPLIAFLPLILPGWLPRNILGSKLPMLLFVTSEITAISALIVVWSAYWGPN